VTLADGEVHVWCASLEHPPADAAELAGTLCDEEHARAARYLSPSARSQFLVGRGLLRTLLGRYLGCDSSRVAFRLGPQGKPALAGNSALHFNVSHSYGLALFAVTRHGPVGVDVERVRPFDNDLDLAERFFCPPEARALRALAPDQRREAFFHVWTRKEAYLKASGTGLSGGLERVEVSVAPGEPARVVRIDGDEGCAARWSLEALAPAPGYLGALALAGHGHRLCCWAWGGTP
jgi:4'-phosphopantetheinyl transferase